ncbi:hypothetical protein Hte_000054 [Hypoxylon texense]
MEDADESVIITSNGRTVHSLDEGIFYTLDLTLALIGITHLASTFSMSKSWPPCSRSACPPEGRHACGTEATEEPGVTRGLAQ